jgi:enterochelin esterase family protein
MRIRLVMCFFVTASFLLAGCGNVNDGTEASAVDARAEMASGQTYETVETQEASLTQQASETVGTQVASLTQQASETVGTQEASLTQQASETVGTQAASSAQQASSGGVQGTAGEVQSGGIKTVTGTGYSGYDDLDTSFDSDKYINRRDGIDYGTVEIIQYYSSVAGQYRTAYMMLPAGYDGTQSYPVLYLAHGINCGPSSYADIGGMEMLNNLIAEGKAVPMIMVGTDNVVTKAGETSGGIQAYDRAVEDITESLMPYVNSHYNTKTGRENTAITGFSMGGRTALYAGFSRQDLFGYVGAVAPAGGVVKTAGSTTRLSTLLDGFEIDSRYGGFRFLMLVAGEDDTLCGPSTESYDELLSEAGIAHMYYRCPGGHENKVWQSEFYNFVKRIFK